MNRISRFAATATALVVAWTSLWPFVSAVHARLAGDQVALCHQAGAMVAPGEAPMPMQPGKNPGPQPQGSGTHCPLCIMAFYGSAAQPLAVPTSEFFTHSPQRDVYDAPRPAQRTALLPPSRGPPASAAS